MLQPWPGLKMQAPFLPLFGYTSDSFLTLAPVVSLFLECLFRRPGTVGTVNPFSSSFEMKALKISLWRFYSLGLSSSRIRELSLWRNHIKEDSVSSLGFWGGWNPNLGEDQLGSTDTPLSEKSVSKYRDHFLCSTHSFGWTPLIVNWYFSSLNLDLKPTWGPYPPIPLRFHVGVYCSHNIH